MRVLAAFLVLAVLTAAQEKPDTPEQAADKVLSAIQVNDQGALKALAEEDTPDPWIVADELCLRGAHDAAEAFAEAAPRFDTEKLPDYVASVRARKPDHAAREAVAAANKLLAEGKSGEALATLDSAESARPDVISVRLLLARGFALRNLRRLEESARAFLAAAEVADRLGWHAGAASGHRHGGYSAWLWSDLALALTAWEERLRLEEARGNSMGVATTLGNIGLIYQRRGSYAKALECHERALKLKEALGDRKGAAGTLGNIGLIHQSRGSNVEALEYFKRTLKLFDELGDRVRVAMTLQNIGTLHGSLGAYVEARKYQERAIEVFEELGDHAGVARSLQNIGVILQNCGSYNEALEYQERALQLLQELEDRLGVARTLGNIGMIHHRRGSYAEALGYLERALKLQAELGGRAETPTTLQCIGMIHQRTGSPLRALEYHERALALFEEQGNQAGVASTLGCIGLTHSSLGSYTEALKFHERALALFEKLGARANVARTLVNLGLVHWRLGSYAEALEYEERALEQSDELGDRASVAEALGSIGLIHQVRGSYSEALDYHERALKVKEESKDRVGMAATLRNIGCIYEDLGSYPEALNFQRRSLKLTEESGDRAGAAASLGNIGHIQWHMGAHAEALAHQQRALKIFEELGDRGGVATVLGNLGLIHRRLEENAKALHYQERALKLSEEIGDHAGVAITLGNIGVLHQGLGAYAEALAYRERARALARKLGFLKTEIANLWGLAALHQARGKQREAIRLGREALGKLTVLVGGFSDELGASARDRWIGLVETGVRAGAALEDAKEVSFFLESGRAGALLEGLGGRERLQAVVIPDTLRAQQVKARDRERVTLWHYRRALDAGEEVEELWAEVQAARGAIVAAHRRIQREAKAQADVLYPEAAPLGEIQSLLEPDEALVLYGLFEKESLALLVTAGDARIVPLGETEPIQRAAEAVQRAVARPDERGVAVPPHESLPYLVKRLRKLVVEPLALGDETLRVLVSPDGPLSYLPFALLTEREVAYVPSGTTYKLLRGERARRGEQVLALGHPDYSVEPDERALMVMRGGERLSALPATKEEVQKIGDELLIGKHATVDGFREAVRQQERWRAVHLACHGRIDPERPALSSLALTGGFLKCLDVYRMKIPADLVVLSACETAKGKIYKAEGVIGFTRAFMFAGAPRVIVSLWKVDDEATRALMVRFYELWKPGKMDTATALKKAQAYVASHEKWKHPYFWAAWQLWGLPD